MPSVHEVSEPLAGLCRPVPAPGPGVCVVCRGCARPEFSTCYSCARVTAQVRRPCHRVVPLSLYAPHLHRFPASGLARVSEVDVLGVAVRRAGETPRPPRRPAIVPYDFRQVLRVDRPTFTLARMAAPRARLISLRRLLGLRFEPHAADVLVQTSR